MERGVLLLRKVLVVHSDPTVRAMVRRVADRAKVITLETADSESGRRMVSMERPQVVVCDSRLPRGWGTGLLPSVRGQAYTASIILVIPGEARGMTSELVAGEVMEILEEPFSPDEARVALFRAFKRAGEARGQAAAK